MSLLLINEYKWAASVTGSFPSWMKQRQLSNLGTHHSGLFENKIWIAVCVTTNLYPEYKDGKCSCSGGQWMSFLSAAGSVLELSDLACCKLFTRYLRTVKINFDRYAFFFCGGLEPWNFLFCQFGAQHSCLFPYVHNSFLPYQFLVTQDIVSSFFSLFPWNNFPWAQRTSRSIDFLFFSHLLFISSLIILYNLFFMVLSFYSSF